MMRQFLASCRLRPRGSRHTLLAYSQGGLYSGELMEELGEGAE